MERMMYNPILSKVGAVRRVPKSFLGWSYSAYITTIAVGDVIVLFNMNPSDL
jgi:hypothetical protein